MGKIMKYDLVIVNANAYTLNTEGEKVAALAIKKGKIAKLMEDSPLEGDISSLTKKVLNAQGCTILPGFIDSHVHFMTTAIMKELCMPISQFSQGKFTPSNLEGVKDMVVQHLANLPPSKPIIFNNYLISSIEEGRLPNRYEMDLWAPNRSIGFFSMDGHSCSFSTPSLQRLGITSSTFDGILTEDMPEFDMDKIVQEFTSNLSLFSILRGVQATVNDAISYGLVGLHSLDGFQSDPKKDLMLKFMKFLGSKLPLKIRLFPQNRQIEQLQSIFNKMSSPRVGGCGAWEMDGAVGAKTAAFYEPYKDNPQNKGTILFPREELIEAIQLAQENHVQVTSHAIGTRAIDHLIDAYDTVLTRSQDLHNSLRHRIDHFEFPTKEALDRAITRLNLLIVPQPGFNWINAHYPGMQIYEQYLEPKVIARQNPLKSIWNLGGIICGSTDSPVQDLNPFMQIHGMVNFPIENERLSVYQALRTYTYNGAYATHEEESRGTLSVGKSADFIFLSEDPFLISPDKLEFLRVHKTFIDGIEISPNHKSPLSYLFSLLLRRSNFL